MITLIIELFCYLWKDIIWVDKMDSINSMIFARGTLPTQPFVAEVYYWLLF